MSDRAAWQCPLCQRVYAPHVDTCNCALAKEATPPAAPAIPTGLSEYEKYVQAIANARAGMPFVPPPIVTYLDNPAPHAAAVVPLSAWGNREVQAVSAKDALASLH